MTDDPFTEESEGDKVATGANRNVKPPEKPEYVPDLVSRQAPYLDLIQMFHKLNDELPTLTTREVDDRLGPMFDKLMDAAAFMGISRISVPQLKECCGKRRVWPDELDHTQVVPLPPKKGLGDVLKWIFSWFWLKPCDGCERRRIWLNAIRWPWQKKGD